MPAYRFVGQHAQIHDTPYLFTHFGQLVEMPRELAERVAADNVHLIPAEHFDAVGFTARELAAHGDVVTHVDASREFLEKKDKAIRAWRDYRTELIQAPEHAPVPALQFLPDPE
ncbi:MAG: hypothetical protein NVS1B6_00910 [Steroidobacteraceae bacterium]